MEIKYSKISKIVGTDVLDGPNISTRTKGKMIEIKCLKISDVVGDGALDIP